MKSATTQDLSRTLPTPAGAGRGRPWTTLLAALVIFIAGMVSGSALTVRYAFNRLQFAIHHPEIAPARIAATLQRRLGLDDSQFAEVEKILSKRQLEIAAVRRKFQPEIQQQLTSVRDEVAAVMKESQRDKWTQLFDQFQQRWLPPVVPTEKE